MGPITPRTTLTLDRRALAGRRFVIRWSPGWAGESPAPGRRGRPDTPLDWAIRTGIAGTLALLSCSARSATYARGPLTEAARRFAPEADRAALAQAVERRLARARVPRLVGVFVDDDEVQATERPVAAATALAILLRRSGPLFVPAREPEISLVVPRATTLIFPEDPDASGP
jgi:hypothetical protein